ncbi:MAG TPA: hypothetical protein VJT84_00815 [Gaiellaceae bacterium]|nr:hypothetical protein [Gaiellaceae bacterium]
MRNDWLLFFHVLSAMVLFAGVLAVVTVSTAAARHAWPTQLPLLRVIAFRTNLLVVLPGFIAVHVFGDLLANREFKDSTPDWLDIGFAITDGGLIVGGVLLTLLQFWVLRRTRAGQTGGWPAQVATILPPLVLAALVAVLVLMAAKPVG